MYSSLTFHCILLLTIVTKVASKSFPAAKFFNISESEVSKYSHYLCQTNPSEPKCCNCDAITCHSDCCIDASWSSNEKTLENYIDSFKIYQWYEIDGKCMPVMYPLLGNHKSEHFMIISEYTDTMNCSHPLIEYKLPVFNVESESFYINEDCATADGDYGNLIVNLDVYCKRVFNLTNDDQFDIKSQKDKIKDCVFKIDRSHLDKEIKKIAGTEDTLEAWRRIECHNEASLACIPSNSDERLCHMYAAPSNSFKNQHCQRCIMGNKKPLEPLKDKCICDKGICPFDTNIDDYPITFKLVHDVEKHVVVKGLHQMFSVEEFIGIDININKSNLLCSYNASCCDCDSECFKYKSCCMDILWNPTSPMSMEAYKQLLIQSTAKYKDLNCENLQVGESRSLIGASFLMVTTCPENATIELINECSLFSTTDLRHFVPIIGKDGYLYKNVFCAQCNLIEVEQVVNISVSCAENTILDKNCMLDITDYKKLNLRKCMNGKRWKTTCPFDHKYHDLCRAYKSSSEYRNFHCDLCHGKVIKDFKVEKCSMEEISSSNFPIEISLYDTHTVLDGNHLTYQLGEYCLTKNGIKTCAQSQFGFIKRMIRTVGTLLSIGSYITCVFIVLKKGKILNGCVGKCILNIIFHLMIIDTLLLSDEMERIFDFTISPFTCKLISITIYFCFTILYFFVTAFSIATKSMISDNAASTQHKFRYLYLVAFVCSAVITALVFYLDYTTTIHIRFGNSSICKQNDLYGRFYLLTVPCVLFHLISYVLLLQACFTLKGIVCNDGEELKEKKKVLQFAVAITIVISLTEADVGFFQNRFESKIDPVVLNYEVFIRMMHYFVQSFRGFGLLIIICWNLLEKTGNFTNQRTLVGE